MSNPNNLIRPALLRTATNDGPSTSQRTVPDGPPTPQQATPNNSQEQITALVGNIVQRIFQTQGKQLVQSALNQNANFSEFSDQSINPEFENNLTELDKIPDVVRCLRDFSGQPGEFNSWKKSVDRILRIYEPLRGTPKYYGILTVIRNKITGNADIALESYNTPLEWKAISRCLTLHYADKRDLGTLEYQMVSLIQGNRTVQQFYQEVYSHLSLILNKIGCMEVGGETLNLLTQTYRDKALDTFVRGLKGDLPRLLGIREPADLPQALHLCLKLENQNFRTNYAHNTQNAAHRGPKPQPPQLPRRSYQQPVFYPQLTHLPQPSMNLYRPNNFSTNQNRNFYSDRNQTQAVPPRPTMPKPQEKPEPMDVDVSMRSNRINYINRPRPNDLLGKRPNVPSFHANRNKMQRNYHLDTNFENQTDTELENSREYFENVPEDFNTQEEQPLDFSDLHFLG